jgi:hypothetical protein
MTDTSNISLNAFCFIELRLETSHTSIYSVKASGQITTFRPTIYIYGQGCYVPAPSTDGSNIQ